MDDFVCLNCKITVTAGEKCKCTFSGNNDQQYSLSRLHALGRKIVENIKAKDEYLSTSEGNYSKLCSNFQQIRMKDYENVKLPKNENKKETKLCSYLNRISKLGLLTNETRIIESFQNQYGAPISSFNFVKQNVCSDNFSLKDSTKHLKADCKPKTEFWRSWEIEKVATPVSKDRELISQKKNCSSFFLEEKLPQNFYSTISRETNLGSHHFSTIANFSVDTSVLPVNKKSYNNVNNISKGNLTKSLNFPKVALQPVQETKSLVEKVSESTEAMKDAKNVLVSSEDNTDFIMSPKENGSGIISSNDKLKRNKRTQTLQKPFACKICKKRYTRNSNLRDHYRVHNQEKSFVCNTCGKVFSYKSRLVNHKRAHTGERPYECEICKKAFGQKSTLISHNRTHTGDMPFGCDLCDRKFKTSSCAVRHRLTHTGEKPYKCEICKKTFSQKCNLIVHNRMHTDEMPFGCDFCDKRFRNRHTLLVHRLTHLREKPYECDKSR